MIGFIIPFKRKTDNNWVTECNNLQNTLFSVINQIDKNFKVFVIYTDFPNINFNHKSVEFVKFPYQFLDTKEIQQLERLVNTESIIDISDKIYDHGKRTLFGSFIAKSKGCDFVMPVDADDFISNKISDWVNSHKNYCLGWFVNKGFIKNGSSKILIKVSKHMNLINGSTHIIHVSLLPKYEIEKINPSLMCFFSSHGYLKYRLEIFNNIILNPIPFYSVIYYIHCENWLGYQNLFKSNKFKYYIKLVLRGTYLTKEKKLEFGIKR